MSIGRQERQMLDVIYLAVWVIQLNFVEWILWTLDRVGERSDCDTQCEYCAVVVNVR